MRLLFSCSPLPLPRSPGFNGPRLLWTRSLPAQTVSCHDHCKHFGFIATLVRSAVLKLACHNDSLKTFPMSHSATESSTQWGQSAEHASRLSILYLSDPPSFEASTAPVQFAPGFCLFSQRLIRFLHIPLVWANVPFYLINIAEQSIYLITALRNTTIHKPV